MGPRGASVRDRPQRWTTGLGLQVLAQNEEDRAHGACSKYPEMTTNEKS